MFSGIYKSGWLMMQQEGKCVIDSNERLQQRIEEYEELKKQEILMASLASSDDDTEYDGEEGFKAGLAAEQIDALLYDSDGEGAGIIDGRRNAEPEGMDQEEVRAQAEQELEEARREAEQIKNQAQTEAEQIKSQAEAEAEQIKSQAQIEAEDQKNQVLNEARKLGYDEGMSMAKAEGDKLKAEIEKERVRLENQYDQMVEELEPRFIDTITAVYKHIFNIELQNNREILVHLIESTLRKVDSSRTFIVHVSKDDYPYVSMQKNHLIETAIGGQGVLDIIEDITLRKNECMIETDGGIFDCGVGTQLEELTKKLKLLSLA